MTSCLVAQRRVQAANGNPVYESACPTMRFPIVIDVSTEQESPGGWTLASFTIPAGADRYGLAFVHGEDLDLPFWLFDGLTPFFHGTIKKVTPQRNGELNVECDGSYRLLGETEMRIVWGDGDFGALQTANGSRGRFSQTVDSNGRLILTFPSDTTNFSTGDFIGVDYFLFGEAVGQRDAKGIDAFQIIVGSGSNFDDHVALQLRVFGLTGPDDASPTLLQTINTPGANVFQVSDGSHGAGNAGNPWPSSQYRCIRLALVATTGGNTNRDFNANITTFKISTRGRSGAGLKTVDTSLLAQDIWAGSAQSYDLHAYAVEEWSGTTGGAVVGAIPASGVKASGIGYKEWSSPQDVVEGIAAIDGSNVGMWGPTRTPVAGSHVVKSGNTTANWWYRQPAELTYKPWNDLAHAEYHVRLSKGAMWEPTGQPDDILSAMYVTYQSLKGQPLSVFAEDASGENIVYEQGLHKADVWSIDPSVDSQTAASLAAQYVQLRRQPVLSGTLTVYGDQPGSVEYPGGARCRLVDLRLGVVRIVDAPGANTGRVTAITYTPRSDSNPEMAVLQVNNPAAQLFDLHVARAAKHSARHRRK